MKLMLLLVASLLAVNACAGQWISIPASNIADLEAYQANAMPGISEGVYIRGNTAFNTTESCVNKQYIAITDPKLADRAFSIGLVAVASGRSISVWVQGCNNAYLQGTAVMIQP